MVTLPPLTLPTLPPVAPPAAVNAPPPAAVPVQVLASDIPLPPAPITLPVQIVQLAPLLNAPPAAPVTPAQLLATLLDQLAQPQPAGTPPVTLPPLQVQTPQGTVQIALPAALQSVTSGQPAPALPQILQALIGGQARLQLVPPATPNALPNLTLLIPPVALRPLADSTPQLSQTAPATTTTPPPLQNFTATLLPRSVAAPYIAALPAVPAAGPAAAPGTAAAAAPLLTQLAGKLADKLNGALGTDFKAWLTTPAVPSATPTATPDHALRSAPIPTLPQTDRPLALPARLATPDTAARPNEQLLTPRLLGPTPSDEQLLALDDGHALLIPRAALPAGQTVPGRTVPLLVQTLPSVSAPLTASSASAASPLAATHPALAEAIAQLADLPAAAQLVSQLIVPQDGPIAAPLLFFFAALGLPAPVPNMPRPSKAALHPDLTAALGETGESGETAPGATATGKPAAASLGSRLLAELRQQGSPAHDQSGATWDAYRLPLQPDRTATQPQPLAFYVQPQPLQANDRDAPDRPDQPERAKQTRFLLDLRLSKLGQTQLEGLSRGRTLDLSLRTDAPLPRAVQADLQQRYAGIASAAGLTGTLRFEGAARNLWFRDTRDPATINARV